MKTSTIVSGLRNATAFTISKTAGAGHLVAQTTADLIATTEGYAINKVNGANRHTVANNRSLSTAKKQQAAMDYYQSKRDAVNAKLNNL